MNTVYEILLILGFLFYIPKALIRRRLPHKGWSMRLGSYPREIKKYLSGKNSIWVHAVSVGEVMAVQPLLKRIRAEYPDVPVVLSTITPTGFHVAKRSTAENIHVIYAPLDLRLILKKTFSLINPKILVLVESELWPGMIQMAARRQVPVVVVNGRISEMAYGRYLWVNDLIRPVLECISLFLMQDEIGAARIRTIGVSENRVKILGSLKWDASIGARPSNDVIEGLRKSLGINPDEVVVVGGSTHRQEESFLLESLSKIRLDSKDNVRMVIAPRHLERVDEVLSIASNMGFAAYKASDAISSKVSWQVLVVDSLGELLKYYGIATIVFVGGSLIKRGGQNPIEPASLGKPIIVGPSMENFPEIIQQLLTHSAVRQLKGPSELSGVIQELISNREEADLMGAKAQALVNHLSGISQKTLDALKGFLTAPSLRA